MKIAITSGASWELAKWAGSRHPYLAPLSVILCMQATLDGSIRYSWYRILGTVLGVLFTAFFANYLKVNGWSLALLIIIGLLLGMWLKANEVFIHQIAISILLVFFFRHMPGNYSLDRIRDTMIGVGLAIIIHLLFYPPNLTKRASKSVLNFISQLSEKFSATAQWIQMGCDKTQGQQLKNDVSQFLNELHKTSKDIDDAVKDLKFTSFFAPFVKKDKLKLERLIFVFTHVKKGYSYLKNTLSTLNDWSSSGTMTAVDQTLWANQLRLIGTYIENWKNELEEKQRMSEFHRDTQIFKKTSTIPVQISLPYGMEKQQYTAALYTDTTKFIQEMQKPSNRS